MPAQHFEYIFTPVLHFKCDSFGSNLIATLEEKKWGITKVSESNPLGTMNLYTKCPDSPKLLRHFNHKSELHCTASGKPLKANGFTLWGPRKSPENISKS